MLKMFSQIGYFRRFFQQIACPFLKNAETSHFPWNYENLVVFLSTFGKINIAHPNSFSWRTWSIYKFYSLFKA